ncbi:hypothetical protein [Asticcacaulis sp.]|uniref:hypothetical protein n=1 Tax=Asticcacaulis sp. TaxID=1872648 RepID=UPI002CB42B89|nr:hypothetical protein [Asticcacaulis sp.]HTM79917.1 hypothetical protein [Asticcacaulis sp.]
MVLMIASFSITRNVAAFTMVGLLWPLDEDPGSQPLTGETRRIWISLLLTRDIAGAIANLEGQSLAHASVLHDLVKEGNARALEAGPVEFAFV